GTGTIRTDAGDFLSNAATSIEIACSQLLARLYASVEFVRGLTCRLVDGDKRKESCFRQMVLRQPDLKNTKEKSLVSKVPPKPVIKGFATCSTCKDLSDIGSLQSSPSRSAQLLISASMTATATNLYACGIVIGSIMITPTKGLLW